LNPLITANTIANLRAIGCPEITLKDIIMTDVMRPLRATPAASMSTMGGRVQILGNRRETNSQTKPARRARKNNWPKSTRNFPPFLRELLGLNYEREMKKIFLSITDETNRRLLSCPTTSANGFWPCRDQFEGKRERSTYNLTNGPASPGDIDKLEEDRRRTGRDSGRLLSPQEKEEYQLSMSAHRRSFCARN